MGGGGDQMFMMMIKGINKIIWCFHLDSIDRSLRLRGSLVSSGWGRTRLGIMEELSFSTSTIMLLISSCWKDSKVKMCPNLILSADNFLLRLSIWCLNQFF